MSAMAQLNIRMDPDLKDVGEMVLARKGVAPGQMVRGVWRKLAAGDEAADQLIDALAQPPTAVGLDGRPEGRTMEEFAAFEERLDAFWRSLGIDPETYVPPTEEEWEEFEWEDWQEREHERLIYYAD